jgi:hypothetical protein
MIVIMWLFTTLLTLLFLIGNVLMWLTSHYSIPLIISSSSQCHNSVIWVGSCSCICNMLNCLSVRYTFSLWSTERYCHTVVLNHVNSDHVPSFSCLDVWTNRQATSGVYAITVTTSAYHSRRCGVLGQYTFNGSINPCIDRY